MSRHPMTERRLVLAAPSDTEIAVDRSLSYTDPASSRHRMDLYRPVAGHRTNEGPLLPAVIFVTGYSDVGAHAVFGSALKDWAVYVDWARHVAGEGMIAITYENDDPVPDLRSLLGFIDANAASLGIDRSRLGLWAGSGNVPNALRLLRERSDFVCASLCYGYTLDLGDYDDVAKAAQQYGFVNSSAGIAVADLPPVPMLIVRAGRDAVPGLNPALDRFVAAGLDSNLPLSLINAPDAPHAFDIDDDSPRSRQLIRQILGFLSMNLCKQ